MDYESVWDEYKSYKRMVPCCGGILLNKERDKVLLVRGWKSNAGWSFPRGKINLAESEEACAVREVSWMAERCDMMCCGEADKSLIGGRGDGF